MNGITITEILQDYYLFSYDDTFFHANATVIMTKEGPVVVDTFRDKEQFDHICEFIRSKGWEKPHTIIYTHWHIDHTAGNRYDKGCNIISHKALIRHFDDFNQNHIDRIKAKGVLSEDACLIYPNITIEDELRLEAGDKSLRIIHCPGHTYDSVIVYDEQTGTLIAGDNIVNKEVPFLVPPILPPDEADAKTAYYEKAFDLIQNLRPKTLIPGHGSLSSPEELLALNRKRYAIGLRENLKVVEEI